MISMLLLSGYGIQDWTNLQATEFQLQCLLHGGVCASTYTYSNPSHLSILSSDYPFPILFHHCKCLATVDTHLFVQASTIILDLS